jgi:UDP-4-amino-4,6-dideoxy-N-acetyl-beta-L-altrosamine N-acetyltransferase
MVNMKITIIPLKKRYLEFLRRVRNHPEINKYLYKDVKISKKAQEKWYKNCYLKDKTYLIFIAFDDKIPIGYGQINHIDRINGSCEVGFCLSPEMQGKGYGEFLVKKIIDYAIKKLNLHRICLEVFVTNERAIKLYEKCGFEKEGILKDKIFKHNKFHDVLVMSIIVK